MQLECLVDPAPNPRQLPRRAQRVGVAGGKLQRAPERGFGRGKVPVVALEHRAERDVAFGQVRSQRAARFGAASRARSKPSSIGAKP